MVIMIINKSVTRFVAVTSRCQYNDPTRWFVMIIKINTIIIIIVIKRFPSEKSLETLE